MKYLLIQLAAVLPLVGLTVWAVLEPVRPTESPLRVERLDVAAAVKQCETTERMVEKDRPVVRQMLAGDLINPQPLAEGEPDGDLHGAVAAWNAAERWRALGGKIASQRAKIDARVEAADSPRGKVAAETSGWQEFLDSRQAPKADQLSGAADVLDAIRELIQERTAEQQQLRQGEDIAAALFNAEECLKKSLDDAAATADDKEKFRQQQAQQCLLLLKQEPLASARDKATSARKDSLNRRAQYRIGWYNVFRAGPPGPPPRTPQQKLDRIDERLAQMKKFLAYYKEEYQKQPPSDAESNAYKLGEERYEQQRIERAIAVLAGVDQVEDLLSRAERILSLDQTTVAQKREARREVRAWLKTRAFPKLGMPPELAELRDLQEAIVKPRQRRIGEFEPPLAGGAWQYWSRRRGATNQGEAQIARDQMAVLPGKPHYLKWADEYRAACDRLASTDSTPDDWAIVVNRLEEMQNELAKYRAEWDVPGQQGRWDALCRSWTFEPSIRTARQILQHWQEYQAFVRQDALELSSH